MKEQAKGRGEGEHPLSERLNDNWKHWGSPTEGDEPINEAGMALDCKKAAAELNRLHAIEHDPMRKAAPALVEAGHTLSLNLGGAIEAFQEDLREALGNTNLAILEHARYELDFALRLARGEVR